MGTAALGMPVQVFPNGPPPPPPAPSKSQLSAQPTNGSRSPSMSRKSPTPQIFEPPPLGCRPEIKIPTNPMAALKKVPTPKPKDDFWVEEYRRERSKSPMPSNENESNQSTEHSSNANQTTRLPEPVCQVNANHNGNQQSKSFANNNNNNVGIDTVDSSISSSPAHFTRQPSLKNEQSNQNSFNNNFNHPSSNSPQQRIYSPFSTSSPTPNLPKPLSPIKLSQDENVPIYVRSSQRASSPKLQKQVSDEQNKSVQDAPQFYVRNNQHVTSPQTSSAGTLQKQPSQEQPQSKPLQTQNIPIYVRPNRNISSPLPVQKLASADQQRHQPQQLEQDVPIYVRSFQNQNQNQQQNAPPTSFAQRPYASQPQYNSEPGRQYYQPARVTSPPVQQNPVNTHERIILLFCIHLTKKHYFHLIVGI